MAQTLNFRLQAAALADPGWPRALQDTQRAAGALGDDPFLPRELLQVDAAFDLSPTARSRDGAAQHTLALADAQVLLLELPDGVTVVTHPANLRDTLARIDPDAVDADGTVVFERALRSRGTALRGALGDAVAGGLGAIVSRVYAVSVSHAVDPIAEAARRKACEWLGVKAEDEIARYAGLGVSWLGTKALMWAVESRLKGEPGLYRWAGGELGRRIDPGDPALAKEAGAGPLLVLIHGTGSSTSGSFDELQRASPAYWKPFEQRYGTRVLAFEHRTLSESPIDNALQLARALPEGAAVHLVTHSRGGLVGDLLCLENFEPLIDGYALDHALLGEADPAERERLAQELARAYGEQRSALHELAAELRRKRLRIERYVRVAAPARGTRLASGNVDVFLSALLSLMGWVPAFKGNPVYSAFKRVVLEVARNRTRPNLVPGLEAMLPESPMARFLARATPQAGLALGVISGDVEGGGWLKRLSVLFTDFSFFDGTDNDFVVDTDSMSAGIARPGQASVLFDRGPQVSHFRYFVNDGTRHALRRWLTDASVAQVEGFEPLRGIDARALAATPAEAVRGGAAAAAALPVTVLLPGIMGSHLWVQRRERVWFSIPRLALGGLARLQLGGAAPEEVEAEALFGQFYGDLLEHLAHSQRVLPFAYDWRQPLDVLADRLAAVLREALDGTAQPVRLLAHSMGGLVVRALVHRHAALWDELMARDGARLVMLGTPHQGSHLMVESLLGKAGTVRSLGVLDLSHDLQEVLDIIATFPGALQLLPRPGFADTGNDAANDWFDTALWAELKRQARDPWFGNGTAAVPDAAVLERARWLWRQDGDAVPALPAAHQAKAAYVFGCAAKTPCGIAREDGRWKMLGTSHGDGSVTWDSGRIGGIGQFFYMPAEHGALADTPDYFDSICELLDRGTGGRLLTAPPAVRDGAAAPLVAAYDAGPPLYPTDTELAGGLFGAGRRLRPREAPRDVLRVRVRAMDLRQVTQPILVGHYEQDAISGAEALIDRHIVHGELSVRHQLGLYAGAVGTANAVLAPASSHDIAHGRLRGAVVAGLGRYDGSLTTHRLTEAIRTAGLRYLVHVLDSGAVAAGTESAQGLRLASLLIGYNSSANLSITDSVQALLRGIVDANRLFAQATSSKLRIGALDIVEIYLDTAITAAYAARSVAQALNADARTLCRVEADAALHEGEGMRHRLFDGGRQAYWPRLIVTDAATEAAPPEGAAPPPRTAALATDLRYLYLGARARAEAVVHQRQPQLVERMVARQMQVMSHDPDFSRTLFQLLVPHDFKDAARQLQQMVFVLDHATANLPWELMAADDTPLAVSTAMVRQLATASYRTRVNPSMERRAYVVGNPSTEGIDGVFATGAAGGLDDLPAAEQEANAVIEVLARQGFEVERAVGAGERALDVMNRLYRRPYRIVHIAGHGVYDECGIDGRERSGVALSDGLLVTAAEIDAMETVPELVFLNCCHLGRIDRGPIAFNKLAVSVARQLIDIGVRAVVVAGWAVEDAPARHFAEVFYDRLLAGNRPFGDAVFAARCATWERYPASITWGAYQAWGDPSWRAEPNAPQAQGGEGGWSGVAPEELLDRLEGERLELQRSGSVVSPAEAARLVARVQQWFATTPRDWIGRPELHAALGDLYADLGPGHFELAARCYEEAIRAGQGAGRVPIRSIEQLANVEARLGEARDNAAIVARGIRRLEHLVQLTGAALPDADGQPPAGTPAASAERAGLLGSAWKRKAAVHARGALAGRAGEFERMRDALERSARCYGAVASQLGAKTVAPYQTLNWLFIWSLTALAEERRRYVPHVQRCVAAANAGYADEPQPWNVAVVADAALITALLDESLAAPGAAGERAFESVAAAYEEVLRSVLVTPRERDSVLRQVALVALFQQAIEQAAGAAPARATGHRLQALVQRLARGGAASDAVLAPLPPAASRAAPRTRKRRAPAAAAPAKPPPRRRKAAKPAG